MSIGLWEYVIVRTVKGLLTRMYNMVISLLQCKQVLLHLRGIHAPPAL